MRKKADADEIEAFVDSLASSLNLRGDLRRWPSYLFRSDHVENTAAILNRGLLLSRARAVADGVIDVDAASPQIIAGLRNSEKEWVRLYFRPKAPTQFANEGIRPKHKYEYGVHMPVPVYLLFSSKEVLSMEGVEYAIGRLTQYCQRGSDAAFLKDMPFKHVYHNSPVGPLGSEGRSDILNARHSEVLVRNELELDHVRWVVCRSGPERETLLNLLTSPARRHWEGKVIVEAQQQFFHKRGTFIQDVKLGQERSEFTFYANIGGDWRGPFNVEMQLISSGRRWVWSNRAYTVTPSPLVIRHGEPHSASDVRVIFDGFLAYQGAYETPGRPKVLS